LDHNKIESIKPLGELKRLSSLSLSYNKISDIGPVENLNSLYYLFLENNRIKDLTPLFNAGKKDNEGEKRFIPFVNIFVAGNPLSGSSKKQLETLKEYGARIQN
jgi:internalin A